jgi:predicted ATPase
MLLKKMLKRNERTDSCQIRVSITQAKKKIYFALRDKEKKKTYRQEHVHLHALIKSYTHMHYSHFSFSPNVLFNQGVKHQRQTLIQPS